MKNKLILNVVCVVLFAVTAQAAEYRLLTGDVPPWSMPNSAEFPEPVSEIMKEVDQRLGNNTEIEIIPWGRAQEIAKQEKNVIVFPLTRVPEREDFYAWIYPIRKMNFAFVTADDRKLDEEDANSLNRIVVHANSLPQIILQRKGFKYLILFAKNYDGITDMLRLGRADSWFADVDMLRWMRLSAPDRFDLTVGPNIFDGVFYAAGSPDLPEKIIMGFRHTLSEMRKDGTLKKIFARYGL